MKRNLLTGASAILAIGLLLTGCGTTDQRPDAPPTPTDAAPQPSDAPDGGSDSGSAGAVNELRDGTWQVGEAGEVEFTLEGGALSLTEVRPADGWQHRVTDERADEIEVHFTNGAMRWKFEVEIDSQMLEISKELKIRPADDGTHSVGDAAEVTFSADGGTVTLSDVQLADGWEITKRDESSDEIEIDFRNSSTGATAEFEVEIESDGLELEISVELKGPIPN